MKETVYVVDDDAAMRDALRVLIQSAGLEARVFADGDEFLRAFNPETRGCLVLDMRMPGTSGLRVQERLLREGRALPIIFLTGYGEVAAAVEAMKAGAVDFLEKPADGRLLLERIRHALALNPRAPEAESPAPLDTLTIRERQILEHVIAGKSTKQIAADLFRAEKTIEFHRRNIMRKIGAANVADLVRIVVAATPHEGGTG